MLSLPVFCPPLVSVTGCAPNHPGPRGRKIWTRNPLFFAPRPSLNSVRGAAGLGELRKDTTSTTTTTTPCACCPMQCCSRAPSSASSPSALAALRPLRSRSAPSLSRSSGRSLCAIASDRAPEPSRACSPSPSSSALGIPRSASLATSRGFACVAASSQAGARYCCYCCGWPLLSPRG